MNDSFIIQCRTRKDIAAHSEKWTDFASYDLLEKAEHDLAIFSDMWGLEGYNWRIVELKKEKM